MRSDVPVGFTLSSGLDSSSIVSVLKGKLNENNNTYTAAFANTAFSSTEKQNYKEDVEIDEPKLVKKLAKEIGLQPTIVEVDFSDYVERLSKVIYHMESGHSSPAVYPLNAILETASKDVTVVLEGQGADELLGGYISNVQPVYIWELLTQFKFRAAIHELRNFKKVYSLKSAFMLFIRDLNIAWIQKLYYKISGIDAFYTGKIKQYDHIKDYPKEPSSFDNALNAYLFKSHTGGLVNLLHYGDAVSMAHSLESRLPFMDYRLVEFVFTLPSEYKVKNGIGKYIHREAMKGIVPDFILSNPLKFGFDSPLLHLFSKSDLNSASSVLLSEKCLNRGLFSEKAIRKVLLAQKSGKENYSRYLFRMLSVELWFREFID
jgi:asparagine synthase (glutamine-hydrolysing)